MGKSNQIGVAIGQMRNRITWLSKQKAKAVKGSAGQPVDPPPIVMGTFWAAVEPIRGAELFNAQQIKATTTFKITMRNVGPIKPEDQLILVTSSPESGRTFEVVSVYREAEQNGFLAITANELIKQQS